VALGAELVPLDELLEDSGVVTVHVPLTPETRHLVDAFVRPRGGNFVDTTIADDVELANAREVDCQHRHETPCRVGRP